MAKRHFPFKHPTFGTKHNPKTSSHIKVSVYYWWFEYLKRNDDYRKTCLNSGKGECSKLYEHFGDVHAMNFKEWWFKDDRGEILFAEPPTPTIRLIDTEIAKQGELQRENTIVLQIPLDLPINFLVKNFRDVLSRQHKGKRGKRQSLSSRSMFQAKGKIDVAFLEIALMVWDAKTTNPRKPLWEIAQELGIAGIHKIKSGDAPAVISDKKNILAATASRYYRKASLMIKRTAEGTFPH
jgi:hypothetical protein